MIYLPRQRLLILTPPKCATHSLHTALCCDAIGGQTMIGASLDTPGRVDRHTTLAPGEAEGCRKLIVVRNPWDRLVSLYHHRVTYEAGHGRATPSFWLFANQLCRRELQDNFYSWPLTRFYRGVKADAELRVESLAADLQREGLPITELPRELPSHRFRSLADYYDESTLAIAARWANEDARRWDYRLPG